LLVYWNIIRNDGLNGLIGKWQACVRGDHKLTTRFLQLAYRLAISTTLPAGLKDPWALHINRSDNLSFAPKVDQQG